MKNFEQKNNIENENIKIENFISVLEKNREIFDNVEEKDYLDFFEKSSKVNEGQNGIILKLDSDDSIISDKIKELEKKENVNIEKERTIKILKIYDFDKLKNEFENLKEAYSIINTQEEKEKYCKIPFPIFLKELNLEEGLKEKLKKYGVKEIENKLGIMVMEYVKGEDLFNFLAKKVIDKNNQKIKSDFEAEYFYDEETKTEEFTRDLSFILKWEDLGNFDGINKKEAEEKIETEKIKKIYEYLKPRQKEDFVFSKDYFIKIEKTLELLHKNGFYHRDLHERNIIIDENNQEISLIDFGTSIRRFSGNEKDVYKKDNQDDVFMMQDGDVLNLLKIISTSLDEKKEILQNKKIQELEKLSKRLWNKKIDEKKSKVFYEGDKFYLDLVKKVLKDQEENKEFDFEYYFKNIIQSNKLMEEEKLKFLQCFLNDFFNKKEEFIFYKNKIEKEEIKNLLIKKINEEKKPMIKNALIETVSLLF